MLLDGKLRGLHVKLIGAFVLGENEAHLFEIKPHDLSGKLIRLSGTVFGKHASGLPAAFIYEDPDVAAYVLIGPAVDDAGVGELFSDFFDYLRNAVPRSGSISFSYGSLYGSTTSTFIFPHPRIHDPYDSVKEQAALPAPPLLRLLWSWCASILSSRVSTSSGRRSHAYPISDPRMLVPSRPML